MSKFGINIDCRSSRLGTDTSHLSSGRPDYPSPLFLSSHLLNKCESPAEMARSLSLMIREVLLAPGLVLK